MNKHLRYDVRRTDASETLKDFQDRDEAQAFARQVAITWKCDMTVTTVIPAGYVAPRTYEDSEF